ncbi:MAG: penicillin-binding protein 1C [Rhodobacteraceae bacterium]|nr:penicillin-binding protein 1C [Paracoccaceae bacterium]
MVRRLAVFLVPAALFLAAWGRDAVGLWIDRTVLPPLVVATSTEVRGRDGTLLRAFTVDDGRWRMAPGAVDPLYLQMLVAYEDRRFWTHGGVDGLALLRALGQAVLNGRVVSGGSTLTMQVARLLEDSGTGRITGKLRQIRVALALERRLDKGQILDLYLRLAPFGGNLEGVRAASLAYLGKEPRRLTPAEAALLVAIPQAPERRRPDRFPDAARAARGRVLERMIGAGVIGGEPAAAALTEAVPDRRRDFPALAPHLAGRLVAADPVAGIHDTTIDPALQASMQALAARAVEGHGDMLSAAILVADHRTGEVLASVGAARWTDEPRSGYVDMTLAPRSPGSTLKPFVYGLAFDEGLAAPATLIEDRPVAFGTYAPQNFDRSFHGTVTVREALELSLNVPVVQLTSALGPARLMTALSRAGVHPVLPDGDAPGLAVALGGLGVTLFDLVQAYAALARLGEPVALHVVPDQAQPGARQRLFSPEAAWMVADILAGMPPPPDAPPGRLAYKTGTSYGHRDAWAIGFDGAHVVGVWMGRADGSPVPGAFGADLAAPVLFEAFARLRPVPAPLPPPPPATLILPTAQLPLPLQRFRPRDAAFAAAAPDAPVVAFPPDGAEVETGGGPLTAKVRNGAPPFTWLANGAPVAVADRGREVALTLPVRGAVRLSVVDALGRSASVAVTVD